MLYSKNQTKKLDTELFKNPTCEYRGTPFWAWNCKLTKEELLEQIDNFKTMGMGGFHMHVRTGMASPYLDDEFMGYIRLCIEEAKKCLGLFPDGNAKNALLEYCDYILVRKK